MINKIGVVTNLPNFQPAFKAEQTTTSRPVTNPHVTNNNISGLGALGTYNKAYTEKLNIAVSPLLLSPNVNPKEAIGEKIYSSDGKLHSIVRNTDKTKIIYQFNSDETNSLDSIAVTDAKTGKIIKEQIGYDTVLEYHPITSKIVKESHYEDGKPHCVTAIKYEPHKEIETSYFYDTKDYMVTETNTRTKDVVTSSYDKNKQLTYIHSSKEKGDKEEYVTLDFYNGSLISARSETTVTMPNTMGRDAMKLENLTPHEKFNLKEVDLKSYKGDKTYYSNGVIETNTMDFSDIGENGFMTCHFAPNGKLEKITSDNGTTILFKSNGTQIIKENLDANTVKKTTYVKDSIFVEVTSDDECRMIDYDAKGNITRYEDSEKVFYYNKKGMLEYTYAKN